MGEGGGREGREKGGREWEEREERKKPPFCKHIASIPKPSVTSADPPAPTPFFSLPLFPSASPHLLQHKAAFGANSHQVLLLGSENYCVAY